MARAHTRGHCLKASQEHICYPSSVKFINKASMCVTLQAARRWHKHILAWMEANGYLVVNSEKTIFMKREGKHFIIHGLFVDGMMHIATNNKLKNELMEKYLRDFQITGGGFMKTFFGMDIEHSNRSIQLHLDHYVCEMLNEYKAYIKKSLRPKRVPFSPGVILRPEDSHRSFTGHLLPSCGSSGHISPVLVSIPRVQVVVVLV